MSFQKEILEPGSSQLSYNGGTTNIAAVAGDTITVECTGYGKNGDLNVSFWSTGTKDLFSFKVGCGEVIKGWDEGCLGLNLGARVRLRCPPDYAYGSGGFPAWGILPNSTLIFEIKMIAITRKAETFSINPNVHVEGSQKLNVCK